LSLLQDILEEIDSKKVVLSEPELKRIQRGKEESWVPVLTAGDGIHGAVEYKTVGERTVVKISIV